MQPLLLLPAAAASRERLACHLARYFGELTKHTPRGWCWTIPFQGPTQSSNMPEQRSEDNHTLVQDSLPLPPRIGAGLDGCVQCMKSIRASLLDCPYGVAIREGDTSCRSAGLVLRWR